MAVEDDGAARVNREHRLVGNGVAACDGLPRTLLLGGVLAGEDILVAFFFESIGTRFDFFADGVQGTLEVEELGLERIYAHDKAEGCRLGFFNGRDGDALTDGVHFDIGIGADFGHFSLLVGFLLCHLVKLHCFDGLFRKPQKTTDIHFNDNIIHKTPHFLWIYR